MKSNIVVVLILKRSWMQLSDVQSFTGFSSHHNKESKITHGLALAYTVCEKTLINIAINHIPLHTEHLEYDPQ